MAGPPHITPRKADPGCIAPDRSLDARESRGSSASSCTQMLFCHSMTFRPNPQPRQGGYPCPLSHPLQTALQGSLPTKRGCSPLLEDLRASPKDAKGPRRSWDFSKAFLPVSFITLGFRLLLCHCGNPGCRAGRALSPWPVSVLQAGTCIQANLVL